MKIIISIAATVELIYNGASGYRIGSGSPDPPLYFFISLCNALASSGVFTFSSFFKYSLCTSGVLSSFFMPHLSHLSIHSLSNTWIHKKMSINKTVDSHLVVFISIFEISARTTVITIVIAVFLFIFLASLCALIFSLHCFCFLLSHQKGISISSY